MNNNVRKANALEILGVKLQCGATLKDIMFCAHDEREHAVCWSPIGGYWRLENVNGVTERYVSLVDALNGMRRATGVDDQDWTFVRNPYGD